jgi:CubicO group peptidase (beta-lactamase class C family)
MTILLLLYLSILAWPSSARAQTSVECGVPETAASDWQIGTQQGSGIDSKPLCALIDELASTRANIHSVLVVRNGRLVFEHYRDGTDQKWGMPLGQVAHSPRTKHDVRSISKSIVSLLVGIALDRKLIASIDQPVFKFFPEYASLRTPAKDLILIRHLLTMSSGIAWDEKWPYTDPRNSEFRMIYALDPYRFVLEQPMVEQPGKVWNYSGGSTALLGTILQKVTDYPLADFARVSLFEPMGISDFEWVKMPFGEIAAASGLRLRSRDMAKIGQLLLSRGEWQGQRIVSAKWLEESLRPRFQPEPEFHYGYQWWIGSSQSRKIDWFEAYGLGGQRIIALPASNAVVVFTTGLYFEDNPGTTELLERFIFPALVPHNQFWSGSPR